MKLARRQRIALELLGPPLLGGAMAALWTWSTLVFRVVREESFWAVGRHLNTIPVLLLTYVVFAFPAIGIQAGCYAAIMEWRFSRGLAPGSWRSVALSTLLGFLSGLPLALGYGYENKDTWYLFNFLGPAVGLGLGLLIRRWNRASARV